MRTCLGRSKAGPKRNLFSDDLTEEAVKDSTLISKNATCITILPFWSGASTVSADSRPVYYQLPTIRASI